MALSEFGEDDGGAGEPLHPNYAEEINLKLAQMERNMAQVVKRERDGEGGRETSANLTKALHIAAGTVSSQYGGETQSIDLSALPSGVRRQLGTPASFFPRVCVSTIRGGVGIGEQED
eukprot:3187493-Rhodomonas_salina.2